MVEQRSDIPGLSREMHAIKTLFLIGIATLVFMGSVSCEKRDKKDIQLEEIVHISNVSELTPELFVRITIQYQRENRKWIETSQRMESKEQEVYLNRMNEDFFARIGITEQQYLAYGEQNADALDAYVQEHPELMRELLQE
jgi:hypothetical protein